MTNKLILLFGTMLKSTSGIHTLKYGHDKKKKRRIIGNYIGFAFLYLMIIAFSGFTAVGYGMIGLERELPIICAISVSAIAFILTLLRSNGYLFGYREYDMLMAMPIPVETIVASKFLYMYAKIFPLLFAFSFAMMIGYGVFAAPAFYIYPLWMILTLVLPLIPSVAASAVGLLVIRIGISFKHKKMVQSALTFVFIIACFMSRFIISAFFRDGSTEQTLESIQAMAESLEKTGDIYLPAKWFTEAINDRRFLSMLLLVGVSAAIAYGFFYLVSKSYRMINSRVKADSSKKDYKMTKQKSRSVVQSIAAKEYRRLIGSTVYTTNACVGQIMVVILGVAAFFVDGETLVSIILQDAPITPQMLIPAIPFVIHFLIGMVATTCCSLSLEGKNYWILQSLPIRKLDIYRGKMRFNLYMSVPFAAFGVVALGISFHANVIEMILCIVLSVALCIMSTVFGMISGIKFARFDWENEVEVIKQGAAVAVYILPNMLIISLLVVLAVVLGLKLGVLSVLFIMIVGIALLDIVGYLIVCKMA